MSIYIKSQNSMKDIGEGIGCLFVLVGLSVLILVIRHSQQIVNWITTK